MAKRSLSSQKKAAKAVARAEEKRLHVELISQLLALSTSGFGLVAALAWNETIQEVVKSYIEPRIPGSGLLSRFIYALLVTVLAVFITYQLSRLAAHFNVEKTSSTK